ncbi:hypothetical protein DSO57_1022000 [Entomophthora muscae]|uniref:Uncharacterized protein n=1 Tax=Entomophthora muscae TaxID=34485 RepID=A0ACC2U1B3_9FUNG|nr:hypothetical protein DSO57_1022000 [Entomophthora muscae]
MREETGGGKKMKAKGRAAAALSTAPAYAGNGPADWEAQATAGKIAGQGGSKKPLCGETKTTKIGVSEARLSPGEDLDDPNWLDKLSDKDFAALHQNLSPKQKSDVLSQQQLFWDLLSAYEIDSVSAQGWEDNGVCLQDIIKWCSLGLTLEQAKQWLLHQFTVDAATKWCHAGINVSAVSVFRKHQVPRDEALA